MVDIFGLIATIAVIAVFAYMAFLVWKVRKWFIYRLLPHDMRANAMYQAIKDPYADERILLHQEFTGAVVAGQSLKRLIPVIVIAGALVVAPIWYFFLPGINGPFGIYDINANATEDTFVSSNLLDWNFGAQPYLRMGNVRDYTGFTLTNDTTYGFVRVPRPDMGSNVSLFEIGMFRWQGNAAYGGNPNGSWMLACPVTLSWSEDTFTFIEFSLELPNALEGGLLCANTLVPYDYIGWVWWNLTGIIGTNDTVMFWQFPPLINDYHVFDSTEGTRPPQIHVIYEGFGPEEKPLWMYAVYIAGVLIAGQAFLLWQRKKKRQAHKIKK